MARYTQETTINAPPQQVFDYVSDLRRHSEWAQHGLEVTQTSSGAVEVGATYASVAHQFGTQRETQTVTEYTPGQRFAFDATGKLGTANHSFEIAQAEAGSRLSKSMEMRNPSFMGRLMAPMIGRQTRKSLAHDLAGIKQRIEAGSG